MKALILCHKTKNDLGSMKKTLGARGFALDYIMAQEDKLGDMPIDAHDLAVILGGPMGVYEAADHPYLLNEIAYIKKRLAAKRPLIGICLGAQLMAKSMGGDVFKGTNGKETGWHNLDLTKAGHASPLRHLDAAHVKVTQSHQDSFDLPAAATLLASTNKYKNQAFQIGTHAIATQFHPEANHYIIDQWLTKHAHFFVTDDMPAEKIRQDTTLYLEKLQQQTALFLNEWLDQAGVTQVRSS